MLVSPFGFPMHEHVLVDHAPGGTYFGVVQTLATSMGSLVGLGEPPSRLDGHRYSVIAFHRMLNDGRDRVFLPGLEEAAGFGNIILYNPDLVDLILGYRRHVLDY